MQRLLGAATGSLSGADYLAVGDDGLCLRMHEILDAVSPDAFDRGSAMASPALTSAAMSVVHHTKSLTVADPWL